MKRLKQMQPTESVTTSTMAIMIPSMGPEWNAMTLPAVPSADWPASLVLDHAIDRVVREALSSGRSLQEAVARVTELANSILPQITDAEIDVRVHAQVLANI